MMLQCYFYNFDYNMGETHLKNTITNSIYRKLICKSYNLYFVTNNKQLFNHTAKQSYCGGSLFFVRF